MQTNHLDLNFKQSSLFKSLQFTNKQDSLFSQFSIFKLSKLDEDEYQHMNNLQLFDRNEQDKFEDEFLKEAHQQEHRDNFFYTESKVEDHKQQDTNHSKRLHFKPIEIQDFQSAVGAFQIEAPNFTYELKSKNISDNAQPIWKVTKSIKKQDVKKKRNYDKNICRYIARQCVRCFVDKMYKDLVMEKICNNDEELYNQSTTYFLSMIEYISGHRAFKQILIVQNEDEYSKEKQVFKHFALWFLQNRAMRYILSGNMSNKSSYIKYKNDIMIYYIMRPEEWLTNIKKPFLTKPLPIQKNTQIKTETII